MSYLKNLALLSLVLVAAPALARDGQPAYPGTVDHSDPVAVTVAIFIAARTLDASDLSGLCDPLGENDGDTRDICQLTPDDGKWDEFVAWFEWGMVSGSATIEGDRATVPLLFGSDGSRSEEMNLINRDGMWYLSSF